MTDRYAVIGHPVEHSRSPAIHAAFARQTGQDIEYLKLLAPLDGFVAAAEAFRTSGGRGMNVTLPFKEEAFAYAGGHSERARSAGAVNTLRFDGDRVFGDNTDGAGLVRDIRDNLGVPLRDKALLLLGAGGAARGAIRPLLDQGPASLTLANRRPERALALALHFDAGLAACGFAELAGRRFDIVINATAASLEGEAPALPAGIYAPAALAYDMMYAKAPTPFLAAALAQGARTADGLGMLLEQAAESFLLWRGVRPDTRPLLAALRASLA
ncbi:MAG: shikimate dehydrogenase [Burkholderiales bacterium]|nr:shikimate dehydrogenase [Burkholderiales bacterium]